MNLNFVHEETINGNFERKLVITEDILMLSNFIYGYFEWNKKVDFFKLLKVSTIFLPHNLRIHFVKDILKTAKNTIDNVY